MCIFGKLGITLTGNYSLFRIRNGKVLGAGKAIIDHILSSNVRKLGTIGFTSFTEISNLTLLNLDGLCFMGKGGFSNNQNVLS